MPTLPVLVTLYCLAYWHRHPDGRLRRLAIWLGSNMVGLCLAIVLFFAFHALTGAESRETYNYPHFGFSSYISGRQRQVESGDKALDGVLYDTDGRQVQLSSLWKEQPIVLEFGSITCPVFVGKVPTMEALAEKYQTRIAFYVLYTREAHPGRHYPAHRSLAHKLECAADLKKEEQVTRTILVDDVGGELHLAYGAMPNSVYLIGTDGAISHRADWLNPEVLDGQIQSLLAAGGQSEGLPATSLTDNFTQVNRNALATTLRVFARAGLASGADFFLNFPHMMGGRLEARSRSQEK